MLQFSGLHHCFFRNTQVLKIHDNIYELQKFTHFAPKYWWFSPHHFSVKVLQLSSQRAKEI